MILVTRRVGTCNTKLGTLIIGYFSLVQALIGTGVILLGFALLTYYTLQDKTRGQINGNQLLYTVAELLTCLFINFIHIGVSILLLRGVRKERRGLLLPWLIATSLAIILFSTGLLLCYWNGYYHPILLGVLGGLGLLDACFVSVVAAHYRRLGRAHSWDYEDLKVLRNDEQPDEDEMVAESNNTHHSHSHSHHSHAQHAHAHAKTSSSEAHSHA